MAFVGGTGKKFMDLTLGQAGATGGCGFISGIGPIHLTLLYGIVVQEVYLSNKIVGSSRCLAFF